LNFWGENSEIEFPKLVTTMGSFVGEGDDHGMHFQTIISLMSLVKDTDVEIWNELCRLYRIFFPAFSTQIHWPFKAEIFDLVDSYVRLREKRGINTIEDPSDDWSWRDQKLNTVSMLDEHYSDYFYLFFHENKVSLPSLPKGLIDHISSRFSFKVCTKDELMFHAWSLWEPAGIFLLKILKERMIDNHNITPEFFIAYLEQQGFFNPYDQELLNYEYLMHIARHTELRLNLDFVADTIEILPPRPH